MLLRLVASLHRVRRNLKVLYLCVRDRRGVHEVAPLYGAQVDAISKFRSFLGRVRWHCLGGMRARALKDERMHQKPSVLEVLSHPPAARRLAGVVNTNSVVRPPIEELAIIHTLYPDARGQRQPSGRRPRRIPWRAS